MTAPTTGIIDVHAHLGRWPFPLGQRGAEGIVAEMARLGIEHCILSSALAIKYDLAEGNQRLAEAIADHPGLWGYVVVNPNFPDESRRELDRRLASPKFLGVKIHPSYAGQPANSPAMKALLADVAARGKPLLIHTYGTAGAAQVAELLAGQPQLPGILGHGGGNDWHAGVEAAAALPHTFVEFCCSYTERGRIRVAVDRLGAERVLFGSDHDLINPAFTLGEIEEADLTQPQRRLILRDNAMRLFALPTT